MASALRTVKAKAEKLTMASPEGIISQNLSLHCVWVTWMHSNVLRRCDSQGRLLPFVLPRVAIAHRGPVRALHVQLSMGTAHTAAGQALIRRETQ